MDNLIEAPQTKMNKLKTWFIKQKNLFTCFNGKRLSNLLVFTLSLVVCSFAGSLWAILQNVTSISDELKFMYLFSVIVAIVFQVGVIIKQVKESEFYFLTFAHTMLIACIFFSEWYEVTVTIGACAVILDLLGTMMFASESEQDST